MTTTIPAPTGTTRTPTRHDVDRALMMYTRLGWRPCLDDRGRVTVATGHAFDAITVPVSLGMEIHRELGAAMLGAPIVTDPVLGRCTVLACVAEVARIVLPEDLTEVKVRALPRRAPVLLPVPLRDGWDGCRFWINPPDELVLPPWTAVIGAARRAVNRVFQ